MTTDEDRIQNQDKDRNVTRQGKTKTKKRQ